MAKKRQCGLTLIELLASTSILLIVSMLGYQSMRHITRHNDATEASTRLVSMVQVARHSALSKGKIITLCGSQSGERCDGSWSDTLIIFDDANRDGRPDTEILQRWPAIRHGHIRWQAFLSSRLIHISPSGLTMGYNGTFIYCPHDNDLRYARAVVLNKSGRARLLQDSDRDGIVNLNTRENIRCP